MNQNNLDSRLEQTVVLIKRHINTLHITKNDKLLQKIRQVINTKNRPHISVFEKIHMVLRKIPALRTRVPIAVPSTPLKNNIIYTYEQRNGQVINTGNIIIPFLQKR